MRPELPDGLWRHICQVVNYTGTSLPPAFDADADPTDGELGRAVVQLAHRASQGVRDLSLPANLDAVMAWNGIPVELHEYLTGVKAPV